ncbi:putative ATPase [Tessaracoccus oleiagri]|uniref:Putative ATPase n=1 Tax=Tessaracoccus oleiagri TaxID=686624 RepID=A0A1G9MAX5_9ACTN|nr:putative ATPase [Tessaracoccus oleiagri]
MATLTDRRITEPGGGVGPATLEGVTYDLFGNLDTDQPVGSLSAARDEGAPLAVRMRPRTLDEIVGQQHLLAPGSPLRRLVEGQSMSVFLWGPPGVGKTTLASIVSRESGARFVEVSAVSAGVKEIRAELDAARRALHKGTPTVLFIDEVHRFSKTQQDALLPAVENRIVTLIAATTENPSFSVISPLLSRSLLLRLKPLTDDDIHALVARALVDERGLGGRVELDDAAREELVRMAGGDARRALTYLEESSASAVALGEQVVTPAILSSAVDRATLRYDPDGDQHYDVISAFIKSIRGSDVDAALHYLARMLEAGEDPRFIARRLMISASEDIGLAANNVLPTCVAAAQAVQLLGMPEARITLAHATVVAATAPKSNAAYTAIDAAIADVRAGKGGPVPAHLRDAHYSGAKKLGHGEGYKYPHSYPHNIVAQTYLPEDLVGTVYYEPTSNGVEQHIAERVRSIREVLSDRVTPSRTRGDDDERR